MSRRTKLLITAVFLVLLGIVAVYAVRLWTVKEPLRFRVVGVSRPVRGEPPHPEWRLVRYEIEVRNVTSVPVSIERVFVIPGDEDEIWFEYKGRNISRYGWRDGNNIGGHKTEQMDLYFYGGVTDDEDLYPWDVTYEWEVPPLRRMNSWLRENTPGFVRYRIPSPYPSYSTATLEFPPGSRVYVWPGEASRR
jgi:hypothetical protein